MRGARGGGGDNGGGGDGGGGGGGGGGGCSGGTRFDIDCDSTRRAKKPKRTKTRVANKGESIKHLVE